jgi:uncharacterized membrane protein YadS
VSRAEREHEASTIAFTAILGVIVVLGLPFLMHPLHLDFYQYGVLAGLAVYAVPQVLAADSAIQSVAVKAYAQSEVSARCPAVRSGSPSRA